MTQTALQIRAGLSHPVIDADGHFFEYLPAIDHYLKEEGVEHGMAGLMRYSSFDGAERWDALTPQQRRAKRPPRTPWWGNPMANTLDFATSNAPRLLHSRLDELGIDFAVCYPSIGLLFPNQRNDQIRVACCRALNRCAADIFTGLEDRMTAVAVIPMFSPEEAIAELDHAVHGLGYKTVMLGGFAVRPMEGGGEWVDHLGLDSAHDYDPVWQYLMRHKLSAAFHSGSMGWTARRSVSNFSYNHMGHFGAASEATAKSLFFGGVFHRFPDLRLAFLEGGVTWAVQMLVDLIGHYEKRGPEGLQAYDPSKLDAKLFDELMEQHAGSMKTVAGAGEFLKAGFGGVEVHEDFAAAGVHGARDIVEQVTRVCTFGCEADDPLTGIAFDRKRMPLGAEIKAVFSSDIGHWDVPDMRAVLPEAYEHIEHGWLDAGAFRRFMCDNAHRLYSETNPDFFRGTVLDGYQPV